MKHLAAALLLLCLPALARAQQPVHAHYAAYAAGLNVLRLDADLAVGPRDYRVHLVYHTAGTVGALFRAEQDTVVEGVFVGDRPAPRRFYSFGHIRGRPRVTQIDYPKGQPEIHTLNPPNDEEREPVAASADQAGTVDSAQCDGAISAASERAAGRCDGRSPHL